MISGSVTPMSALTDGLTGKEGNQQKLQEIQQEIRRVDKLRKRIPSGDPFDTGYKRLFYARYADDFAIGDLAMQNLTMAVATMAKNVNTGIMGIGLDTDESLPPGKQAYPNIVDEMVTQGLINTRAYSLWLDDLSKTSHHARIV